MICFDIPATDHILLPIRNRRNDKEIAINPRVIPVCSAMVRPGKAQPGSVNRFGARGHGF